MSPVRKLPRAVVGLTIAAITALLVVIASNAVSGGASPVPTDGPHIEPVPSISQEDEERLQATIDALIEEALQREPTMVTTADGAPAPSTPSALQVGNITIELPDGFQYDEVIWSNRPDATRRTAGAITYVDSELGISRLYIDPLDGTILRNAVLPQHAALFDPVLTALNAAVQ